MYFFDDTCELISINSNTQFFDIIATNLIDFNGGQLILCYTNEPRKACSSKVRDRIENFRITGVRSFNFDRQLLIYFLNLELAVYFHVLAIPLGV